MILLGKLIRAIAVIISPFVVYITAMGFGMSGELGTSQDILRFKLLILSLPIINLAIFLFGHFTVKRFQRIKKLIKFL